MGSQLLQPRARDPSMTKLHSAQQGNGQVRRLVGYLRYLYRSTNASYLPTIADMKGMLKKRKRGDNPIGMRTLASSNTLGECRP
eukprot:144974-Alexandrium_andersonii.AAC.1